MTDSRERDPGCGGRKRDKRRRRLERKLDHRLAKFDRKLARKLSADQGGVGDSRGRHPGRRRVGRREVTPEERAYREARRRANARLSVWIHGVVYALVLLMLMVVTRGIRVPLIVGVCWGIGFGTHYFVAVVAPRLRRRWIQDEVAQQVQRGVSEQRQVVEGQHVRSLEELSASIAHEIRNPITAAKSLVQQMGEDPLSGENIEYAQVALDELDRVERSISHLLKYARDEELRLERVSLGDVVASAIDTFRDRIGPGGVHMEWDRDADGVVRGDSEKLRRIVINLVGNAIDVLEESHTPEPRIVIGCGENLAGSQVWLRIRDNGPGIDEDRLRKIFDPFYTTKDRGTGLGLALSKKIVDAHGGTLEVESTRGEGSEFVMTLPKLPGAATGSSDTGDRR